MVGLPHFLSQNSQWALTKYWSWWWTLAGSILEIQIEISHILQRLVTVNPDDCVSQQVESEARIYSDIFSQHDSCLHPIRGKHTSWHISCLSTSHWYETKHIWCSWLKQICLGRKTWSLLSYIHSLWHSRKYLDLGRGLQCRGIFV